MTLKRCPSYGRRLGTWVPFVAVAIFLACFAPRAHGAQPSQTSEASRADSQTVQSDVPEEGELEGEKKKVEAKGAAKAKGEEEEQVGKPKETKKAVGEERKPIAWTGTYATTEEMMLPADVVALRRSFTTTDPAYFGGKVVEEQALFEALARRDEEELYYAIEGVQEKSLLRNVLEALSAIIQYKQGFYTDYFNEYARQHPIWTETPFFGLRAKRFGVLSADANYFVSLERLSFERAVSVDPHIAKTHGGQARLLYRPSKRFHVLVTNNTRKSNKIVGVEGASNEVSLGNNVVSNSFGAEARYFLTEQNVIDLNFNYDYSRARSSGDLRISRSYQHKISFLRSFGSRLILRGFLLFDYLKAMSPAAAATTDSVATDTAKLTSFRHEPGIGGTFVLRRRLVLDADWSRQRLKFRDSGVPADYGHRVNLKLTHQLTNRLSHKYEYKFSRLEGKRSAISKVSGIGNSAFESFLFSHQFSFQVTPLTQLGFTADYLHTSGGSANNRKRILVDITRPLYRERADLTLSYAFEKNDGDLASSYLGHTVTLAVKTTYGAGRAKGGA